MTGPSIPGVGGGGGGGGGSDSRFFTTQKKGEMHELRLELHSTDRTTKVDAVKKVIASMTVGKDVSGLFTDVLNCVQTGNIELKKLVYLYLINYAKSQPELTLLAVNTFVKDANDPNPLIRALAVRTMGCIRVDRITEYLCEPLGRALRDEDPVSSLGLDFVLVCRGGGGILLSVVRWCNDNSSFVPHHASTNSSFISQYFSMSGRRQQSASPNSTTLLPISSKSVVSSKPSMISLVIPILVSLPTVLPH